MKTSVYALAVSALMLLTGIVGAGNPPQNMRGVGYLSLAIGNRSSQAQIQSVLDVADRCKVLGLNHINLSGPLIFHASDIDSNVETLIQKLHEKGFTVSYCINTFFDKDKHSRQFAWRDPRGRTVDEEYFCMVASRKTRLPEIKRCIQRGIDAGFDGVLLDYLDWGTNQDNICFCDSCIREFNAFTGNTLSREKLVERLLADDRLIPAWWEWRTKVRTDIAAELVKFASEAAAKQNRQFWVGQIAGRRGTEPEFCGALFDVHAAGIPDYAKSAEDVGKVFKSWKKRVPGPARVIALVQKGKSSEHLLASLQGALLGGADGWLFLSPTCSMEELDSLTSALRQMEQPLKQ